MPLIPWLTGHVSSQLSIPDASRKFVDAVARQLDEAEDATPLELAKYQSIKRAVGDTKRAMTARSVTLQRGLGANTKKGAGERCLRRRLRHVLQTVAEHPSRLFQREVPAIRCEVRLCLREGHRLPNQCPRFLTVVDDDDDDGRRSYGKQHVARRCFPEIRKVYSFANFHGISSR